VVNSIESRSKIQQHKNYFDAYSGSTESEEQEMGAGGGAQVIVRAFKCKTLALENITLSQWMGADVKILNSFLLRNNLDRKYIQDYLAYITKLIADHQTGTWSTNL